MNEPDLIWHHPDPALPVPAVVSGNNESKLLAAANGRRRQIIMQNVGTTAVFLNFGPTADDASGSYFYVLAPCSGAADGYGGAYVDEKWTGEVSAFSTGAFSVVVTEL